MVEIDYSKCLGISCGLCLKQCPVAVFMNVPTGNFHPKQKPVSEKIMPYFDKFCTKCGLCVENCPRKCIRLD